MITTYVRLDTTLQKPATDGSSSGAGELADIVYKGLTALGFQPTTPTDDEFAHFLRCKSGNYEYEIMIAFDFVDEKTWEISCSTNLGFIAKLFGKSEQQELGSLINAISQILQSDARVISMKWNPRFGDRSHDLPSPKVEPF